MQPFQKRELRRIMHDYPKRTELEAVRCWCKEAVDRCYRLRAYVPDWFPGQMVQTLMELAGSSNADAWVWVNEVVSDYPTIKPPIESLTAKQIHFMKFDSSRNRNGPAELLASLGE